MRVKYLVILLLLAVEVSSQTTDTIYFDKDWNPINSGTHRYYRITEQHDSIITYVDYFKNSRIQMKGAFELTDITVNNLHEYSSFPGYEVGAKIWYRKNGNISHITIFDPFKYPDILKEFSVDSIEISDSSKPEATLDIYYYKNGELNSLGFRLKSCEPIGFWRYYTRKGRHDFSAEYTNGLIDGIAVFYSKKKGGFSTEYKRGVKHGKEMFFDEEGKVYLIYIFEHGKKMRKLRGDEMSPYFQ